jgi:hypothetical protein
MSYAQDHFAQEAQEHDMYQEQEYKFSNRVTQKIERYSVSDEDIQDMLFTTSVRTLCEFADKAVSNYYPIEQQNSAEAEKIDSIVASGIGKKYLTDKQKWCLASFCLYWFRNAVSNELESGENE